jgi:hypothetical protein
MDWIRNKISWFLNGILIRLLRAICQKESLSEFAILQAIIERLLWSLAILYVTVRFYYLYIKENRFIINKPEQTVGFLKMTLCSLRKKSNHNYKAI